jgi:hypothetical protein
LLVFQVQSNGRFVATDDDFVLLYHCSIRVKAANLWMLTQLTQG